MTDESVVLANLVGNLAKTVKAFQSLNYTLVKSSNIQVKFKDAIYDSYGTLNSMMNELVSFTNSGKNLNHQLEALSASPYIGDFSGFGKDLVKSVAKALPEIPALLWKGIVKLGDKISSKFSKIGNGLTSIGKGLLAPVTSTITAIGTTFGNVVSKGFSKAKNAINSMTGGLAEKIGLFGNFGIVRSAMETVKSFISAMNPFKVIISTLNDIFTQWGSWMSDEFSPIIEYLGSVMKSELAEGAFARLGEVLCSLLGAFMPIIDIGMSLLLPILDAIIPILNILIIPLDLLSVVFGVLGVLVHVLIIPLKLLAGLFELLSPFIELVSAALKTLLPYFEFAGAAIESWLVPMFSRIGECVQNLKENIVDPWINGLRDIAIAAVKLFNDLIDGINVLIPGTRWDIPHVPMPSFSGGGLVTRTGLALVHAPEVILPAEKAPLPGDTFSQPPVTVQVTVQGSVIAERELLQRIERTLTQKVYRIRGG